MSDETEKLKALAEESAASLTSDKDSTSTTKSNGDDEEDTKGEEAIDD